MRKLCTSGFALATLTVFASMSAAQGRFAPAPVRIDSAQAGGVLAARSSAPRRAVVVQYLRDRGRDEMTAESVVLVSQGALRNGVAHVGFEQRVGGLVVYGTFVKAAFNGRAI